MAVQKHRKTRAKRDQRRAHDGLTPPVLSEDKVTGTRHRRHHIAADGFYCGSQIFEIRKKPDETSPDAAE